MIFQNIFFINIETLALKIGSCVPLDAEPLQGFKNSIHRFLGGAGRVCVLYAQYEFPISVPGIEPVEKGCSGATHMQVTGGAGGETSNNIIHLIHRMTCYACV